MDKIIIVTGANGFLGNNIIRELLNNKSYEIRALVNKNKNALDGLNINIYEGSVTDIDSLNDIFSNTNNKEIVVIHCAAVVYIKSKYDDHVYNVNVNGTKNIVSKCLETNAKLIYVSSVHALPVKDGIMSEITDFNPNDVKGLYAKTKSEAAKYVLDSVKNNNLNACIAHPSGIIGPNDFGNSHLSEMIRKIVDKKLPALVNGGYDFVDVRDVVNGIVKLIELEKCGECFLLTNEYYTIKEISDMVCDYLNYKHLKVLPMWIAKLGAPFCEIYYNLRKQTPLFTKYSLEVVGDNANFSHDKADSELGYKTHDMKDTIKDTVDFFQKQKKLTK